VSFKGSFINSIADLSAILGYKMKYMEFKEVHPELFECFFAFSDKQFEEGIEKHNLRDKKIYSGGYGLYGTSEGIKKLHSDYDKIGKDITEHCSPQEVYDYEFHNHECGYTMDDEDAIKIVIGYFGKEKAKEVERRYKRIEIDNIKN